MSKIASRCNVRPKPDLSNLKDVKHIIAIGSGKGGVGKSTLTTNLAVALARSGAKVGLLDADIYGPSIPIMLGRQGENVEHEMGLLLPKMAHGIKFMSMGFFAQGDSPLIWRGPMAHKAITHCLTKVQWEDLDFLLIDLPPGTGDIHLTLVETIPLTGALIVSTPQDVGLQISMKTLRMFQKSRVKILGIVENMSYHLCSCCGSREDIFDIGGAKNLCETLQIPLLGEIPLDRAIRVSADRGMPIVSASPDSASAEIYSKIAQSLMTQVTLHKSSLSKLPVLQ